MLIPLWPFKKKKSHNDNVKELVGQILFPPIELNEVDGTSFYCDYSIDSNLEAVLCDLQDGFNDEHTIETLRQCISSLRELRVQTKLHSQFVKHKNMPQTTAYMVSVNRDKKRG